MAQTTQERIHVRAGLPGAEARPRMTAAEFARLPESNLRHELINGELIVEMASPKYAHQKVLGQLYLLLNGLIPGGELLFSPMDVYLDDETVFQPDIFWASGPQSRCQLGADGYWHGAPDLVIEIVSPRTELHDRREKFEKYEQHGVREYWLLDPQAAYVEVWQPDQGGRLARQGVYGPQQSVPSAVLGQNVPLTAVIQPLEPEKPEQEAKEEETKP